MDIVSQKAKDTQIQLLKKQIEDLKSENEDLLKYRSSAVQRLSQMDMELMKVKDIEKQYIQSLEKEIEAMK